MIILIWLAILIPILATPIVYFKFPHKLTWWELCLPILISIITIGICTSVGESIQTTDTEWLTYYGKQVKYYEDWNEKVSCRHTKYCDDYYRDNHGDRKKRRVPCGKEHPFDVDYHPPIYNIITSANETLDISSTLYSKLTNLWGNNHFENLNRHYYTNDGDLYYSDFDNLDSHLYSISLPHSYENRVQASSSIYNYRDLEENEKKGLIEYPPENEYKTPFILSNFNFAIPNELEQKVAVFNAIFGKKLQIRVNFLLYNSETDSIARLQEIYWKGGNKNEFNVALGMLHNQINWVYPISWTPSNVLKINIRNYLAENSKIELSKYIDYVLLQAQEHWQRKQFKEFEFLQVEPGGWTVFFAWVLTMLVTGFTLYWSIGNEFK